MSSPVKLLNPSNIIINALTGPQAFLCTQHPYGCLRLDTPPEVRNQLQYALDQRPRRFPAPFAQNLPLDWLTHWAVLLAKNIT